MRVLILLSLLLITQSVLALEGYYRYPTLHNDTLVFTAEGDLWKMKLDEQYAQRLTTHPTEEKEASISPDGQWVAFVANYTGTPEVHVIPIQGGIAKRITFENVGVKVQGWSTDSKVLYSYNGRVGPAGNWTLKQVDPSTLITTTIPLSDAVQGTISADNSTLYFAQFGLQISTDNARAYQGGAKGELWKYTLGSNKEATHLTSKHQGSVRTPMLAGERLYFISNQSGSDNIWSMKLNGRDQQQHTQYQDWEVRSARLNDNKIVYQLGADIKVFDIPSEQSAVVDITLTSDFPELREHWVNDPLKDLTSAKQAGDAKKVVLTARGRVAIAATDGSRLVEIATPKDSRTRKAILSHDKKSVYALNDSSGEMEIWQYPADGSKGSEQLTSDGNIFRWDLYLSPDGKSIAHDDKNGDLWLLDLASKKNSKILSNNVGFSPINSLAWSNDSQLIAITRENIKAERSQVLLIDTLSNHHQALTSEKYASFSPAFSRDSKWLYFLSDRHFDSFPNSPWGDRNMGASFDRRTQIFAIALKEEAKFPFEPPTELDGLDAPKDTVTKDEEDDADNDKETGASDDTSPEEPPKVAVDWQNINQRLWQVPVASGNYSKLLANKKFLYVLDKINEPNSQPELKAIAIEPNSKPKTFLGAVQSFSLSDDGKTIFLQKTGSKKDMYLVSAGAKFSSTAKNTKVNTSDWKLHVTPRQEWQQIFHDAWLMHRDSLFDENMRGLDWSAVRQKYQPLLSRLTDRHELNDIFKQMMGELNTLHSQVRGGDLPTDSNSAKAATLGAEFSQHQQGVKIAHIYSNDPELISRLSPLAKPNVNAQVGDFIHAINGQTIKTIPDIAKALQNQAGKQVLLSLTRANENLNTIVKPSSTRDDYYHRYFDWVTKNQQKVHKADAKLGYLHLRAMGSGDVESFAREFYAQYKKQGLIIDVRRNNGGNVDSWIIEKLLKRAWSFWQIKGGSDGSTNMQQTFRGHLVVLADQYTYSDGETFTAGIKALELGTVIGKQTAGAGVWLTGRNRQSDGGMARVAELPVYAMDGRWITEGRGISPDVEVDNLPLATFKGEDAQLQAAIKLLQKKIRKNPVKPLKGKAFPKVDVPADDIID